MKKEHTRVLRRISAMLLIILTFTVCATGCDMSDMFNTGLENGFTVSSGAPSPGERCAYKSDKTVFDIDDVTLEFCYGGTFVHIDHENGKSYPYFELYFSDEEKNKYFIKRVEENLVSEKYRYEYVLDDNLNVKEIKFNHSETLTIPKEIFTKERGRIAFSIFAYDENAFEPSFHAVTGINIYYKVVGDKVTLSKYEFY